jgi:hypothetical protein
MSNMCIEPPLPRDEPPARPVSSAMTSGIHAGGQHVAVVTVAGDDLVALDLDRLHADRDGFLTDVEVAEAADQAHAVQLAGALLEAADQQHVLVEFQKLVLADEGVDTGGISLPRGGFTLARTRHSTLPGQSSSRPTPGRPPPNEPSVPRRNGVLCQTRNGPG